MSIGSAGEQVYTAESVLSGGRYKFRANLNRNPKPPMERETGIEPATSSLGSWRSTAELLPLKHT
jgi:hypothetical protein